jgi:acetyltransferase-like isoleucine patch superfamily enzyme
VSMEDAGIRHGARKVSDMKLKDAYLSGGRLPLSLEISKGLESVVRDPWLMAIQYMPGPLGFTLRQWYYRGRLGSMGRGVLIDPAVDLAGSSNIHIGDFSYLGRRTEIYSPEGYVRIGKRCHIVGWILGHGGVEIGDCVACRGDVLSVTDSHQGGFRMSGPMIPQEQRNLNYGKIVIEDDAFIGNHSTIMPGVHVGEGAIVAPYSLVIRNVPAWTVVYGSPAAGLCTREKVRFPKP